MTRIFWGFIFTFLDFNLNLNQVTINFIPDFVGYILIYQGLSEYRQQSYHFEQGRPWATTLLVLASVDFGLNLLGISVALGILYDIFGTVILAFDIYLVYKIVSGIREMEYRRQINYNGAELKNLWEIYMVLSIVSVGIGYLSYFADSTPPIYGVMELASVITSLAAFVIAIIFLVNFSKTRKYIEYTGYIQY